MRATLAALTVATLLACSRPLTAQTLPALQAGTYLRLTTSQGFSVDGLLVSQTPDSITINHIEVARGRCRPSRSTNHARSSGAW